MEKMNNVLADIVDQVAPDDKGPEQVILYCYAVKDTTLGQATQFHYLPNDAVALRAFEKSLNDPGTAQGQWPEDFELWRCGRRDAVSLRGTPEDPRLIVEGKAMKYGPDPSELPDR